MNKTLASLLIAASVLIAGCATQPTAFDRTVATVQTNYYPQLVIHTNFVTQVQTVTVTNEVGIPTPFFVTNTTSVVQWQTNIVAQYSLTPSPTSTAVAGIAGSVGNAVVPGVGGLVSSGVLALLSIFLGYRNRQFAGQNTVLSQVAGVLAQTIETGREIMSSSPQGQKAADAFTQWMVTHQAQTGTIAEITKIVQSSTDNVQAQAAANQILALIGQEQAPIKPAT